MSDTKYRKGQWQQDSQEPRIITCGTYLGKPMSLLGLNKDDMAIFFEEDDARLVAAAPDLLVALIDMERKASKQDWNESYPEELQAARDAIEKAITKAKL